MKLKKPNKTIFREYDIRGISGVDLDEDIAYTIGRAVGSIYVSKNIKKIAVGYDNRANSPILFNGLTLGIMESGVDIISIGLVTTPMYYFSWSHFNVQGGVMITASHNPKEYNGFKISFNGEYNAYGDDVKKIYEVIEKFDFVKGKGKLEKIDIKDDYLKLIKSSIDLGKRPLKIVYDCGNGTPAIIADDIFKMFPSLECIALFNESDPEFPNHVPDPADEENMKVLKKTVLKENADLGIAFDGDGDRVGVIDENGNYLSADEIMIIIWRSIYKDIKIKKGLFDVKCSKALEDELIRLDIEPYCRRTGNSYQMMEMKTNHFDFGGEFSGHLYFYDKYIGNDDGIYAGLRLVEILSKTKKPFSELLANVPVYYNTNEIKRAIKEEKKNIVMNKVKDYCVRMQYNILTIDGIRVNFNDGFALIRPSNTGPNMIIRYEAKTKLRLKHIENEFNNLLDNIMKEE